MSNNIINNQAATDKSPNDQAEPRQTSDANNPATEANNKGTAPAVGSGALFGDGRNNKASGNWAALLNGEDVKEVRPD